MMNSVAYPVAVIMQCTQLRDRWDTEAWEAHGVVRDIFGPGAAPQLMFEDNDRRQILYPGFVLALYRDEVEGHYLNVSSPEPRVFVQWREHEGDVARGLVTGEAGSLREARHSHASRPSFRFAPDRVGVAPAFVTVSYNEAARWMDSNEKVDGVAMPPEIYAWVGAFVEQFYRPEPKKMRKRH